VTKIKKQGGLVLDPLTNGFRKLLSAYSHKYNLQNNRTGALFRPKTKAKCITEEAIIKETGLSNQEYFIQCFHYIHNNPLAAGLVELPEQWKWSSCRFYLNQSDETLTLADETPARSDETSDQHSFCNKELAYKFLGIEEGFVR
jgi:putative transposase